MLLVLLCLGVLASFLLVLLDGDDLDVLFVGDLLLGGISVGLVSNDVEGADVAAGDRSVEVLLVLIVVSLVDGH